MADETRSVLRRHWLALVLAAILSIAWMVLINARQWHPDLESLQLWLMGLPGFVLAPVVLGLILGRHYPLPRDRFALPRPLKVAGALATAAASGLYLVVATQLTVEDDDPDKAFMVWGGLVLYVGIGWLVGYFLVGLGSHLGARWNRT